MLCPTGRKKRLTRGQYWQEAIGTPSQAMYGAQLGYVLLGLGRPLHVWDF